MKDDLQIDERDKRTRKWWLRLTIALWIISVVSEFFSLLNGDVMTLFSSQKAILGVFTGIFLRIASNTFGYWFIYHCAYKHPGTKWLTFQLIMWPGVIIKEIAVSMKEFVLFHDPEVSTLFKIGFGVIALALLVVDVWWFFQSMKLRAVNKRKQMRLIYESEEYTQAQVRFGQARDAEELKAMFDEAIYGKPGKLYKAIKKLYAAQKQALANPPPPPVLETV